MAVGDNVAMDVDKDVKEPVSNFVQTTVFQDALIHAYLNVKAVVAVVVHPRAWAHVQETVDVHVVVVVAQTVVEHVKVHVDLDVLVDVLEELCLPHIRR